MKVLSVRREYDIEIQRANDGAEPKRARYNSALMDANALKSGEDVGKLRDALEMYFDVLRKQVSQFKNSEEGRCTMCRAMEKIEARGERKNMLATANRMLKFGVARATAVAALKSLEREGLVESRRGSGTYPVKREPMTANRMCEALVGSRVPRDRIRKGSRRRELRWPSAQSPGNPLQLFAEAFGFGDIKAFPHLYKCGNGLAAYSSNALDAPKRIREGGTLA